MNFADFIPKWLRGWLYRHPRINDVFWKLVKFGVTTLSAFLLHVFINVWGHEYWGGDINILYPISLVVISISTFLQLRYFVYPGAKERNVVRQGGQFVVSSVLFRLIDWALFAILFNVVGMWYVLCIVIVQVMGTLLKFVFYNNYVFSGNGRNK